MEKVTRMKQNNMTSYVKSFESKSCAAAKSCMHQGCEKNKKENERNETEKEH